MKEILDVILHIDKHLSELAAGYGHWMYAILFAIVFFETGVVVTPFLPGDSLLFTAGALCAVPGTDGEPVMNIVLLWVLLSAAAIIGDTLNYHIGKWIGDGIYEKGNRFIKKTHLEKTRAFYEKYGGKAIILARFVPIIRTFAPFVAGIGAMQYRRFILFNIVGALLWTTLFLLLGFWVGNLDIVRKNFSLITLGIIGISLLPIVIEVLRARFNKPRP